MTAEDVRPLVVSVDRPPPPELVPTALGVGLIGPPDNLFLVFHEELRDEEVDAIREGRYRIALKLFQGGGVAGLVWRVVAAGGDMIAFANYSLRHVADALGPDALEQFKQAARDGGFAGHPDCGLLLSAVFVNPDTGLVFALRAFTLPRLFSDRFLRAVLATADQDPQRAGEIMSQLVSARATVWSMARPGIAVAGEKSELDEGDFARLLRSDRQSRARR